MKATHGPRAGEGTVYVVAGSSGWATFRWGVHPVMYFDEIQTGFVVLDINGDRADAIFLRDTGAIDDSFTIIKSSPVQVVVTRTVNQVIAEWKSLVGSKYRVDATGDIETPDWQPASSVITATTAKTSWTNAAPNAAPKRFYRVVEVPE